MLSSKIEVSDELRSLIKKQRERKNLKANEISSNYLGKKSSGFLSAIENGHAKYLKKEDLVTIFKVLYDFSDDEAELKTENMLSSIAHTPQKNVDEDILTDEIDISDDMDILENTPLTNYKTIDGNKSEEEFQKILKSLNKGLSVIFNNDSKKAITSLKVFLASMHFDLGFMVAIMKIPFFMLKNLNHNERQEFLNEIAESFNKYMMISESNSVASKEDKEENSDDDSRTDSE